MGIVSRRGFICWRWQRSSKEDWRHSIKAYLRQPSGLQNQRIWPSFNPMDNYSRIAEMTNVFLRIEHESQDPSEVTALLGISPTLFASEPNPGNARTDPHGKVWVLASAWAVNSKNNLNHFEWLIKAIGHRGPQLKILSERGFDVKIHCLWIGRKDSGGRKLSPEIIGGLAELGVEVCFDFIDLDSAQRAGKNTKVGADTTLSG